MQGQVEAAFNLWNAEIIPTEELTLRLNRMISDPELRQEAFDHIEELELFGE
jgi:hypothetical protein